MKRTIISHFFITVTACACATALAFGQAENITPPLETVTPAFFGLHIHRAAATTTWPSVPFKSWRLMGAYAEWPWIEAQKGSWNFETLDCLIDMAEKKGVEPVMPLAYCPPWASARPAESCFYDPGYAAEPQNMADWRTYVRTVASRYKGRVTYYELWNEPNLKGFYSGSTEKMVELCAEAYKILKEVDPRIVVISPSSTGMDGVTWLDEFLSKGGGKYSDIIGYHFYVSPAPPEEMVPLVRKVKSLMMKYGQYGKPLWNTETGWFIRNARSTVIPEKKGLKSRVLDQDEAAAWLVRSYVVGWGTGVSRLFWYAWDNREMGLTEADGMTIKESVKGYEAVCRWLCGAKMLSLNADEDGTWTAELERGGKRSWIVWNVGGKRKMTPPRHWKVKQVEGLNGEKIEPMVTGTVEIGPTPLFLEGA